MKASLEITGAILRVFTKPDAKHGDPFDFMVGVVGDEGVATLKGLVTGEDRPLPKGVITAIAQELLGHGFTCARWSRRGPDGTKLRDVEIDLVRLMNRRA